MVISHLGFCGQFWGNSVVAPLYFLSYSLSINAVAVSMMNGNNCLLGIYIYALYSVIFHSIFKFMLKLLYSRKNPVLRKNVGQDSLRSLGQTEEENNMLQSS